MMDRHLHILFYTKKIGLFNAVPSWKRESFTTSAEAKWLFRQASYHPKWGVSLKDSISTNFKTLIHKEHQIEGAT